MLQRLTIRQRLLLIFVLVVFTGAVLQFVVAGAQLRAATLEFYQHHLETDGLLVAATFAEPLDHLAEGEDDRNIGRTLAALQQEIGHDYVIVDHDYRVVAYTANTGYEQVDRLTETPELAQARSDSIGSDIRLNAAGKDTLYVAVQILYEGRVFGFLVLSEPMQPAYAEVNQRYLELAGATVPVLALVIIASLWVSGTISRPIQHLRDSALQMARGAFDTRIATTSQDEIGQLADAFNYMAQQLDTLIRTQRSFVSNAAHELRTPLMTLKLRAEALADESLPAVERETYANDIRQEVDHMAGLVSSLLTLARIDEGRHHAINEVVDTVSGLHDVVRHWRITAEANGLQLQAEIAPDLPDLPMSSSDLRLILDNLLSNAIKYTPQGEVRLLARQQGDALILEVRDTGIGFREDQRGHLFERFYRSEDVRGKFSGTGLGLAVAESVVRTYGGSLTAESGGLGQGARFRVVLPLHLASHSR
jgi:signal transduction histidine kinase